MHSLLSLLILSHKRRVTKQLVILLSHSKNRIISRINALQLCSLNTIKRNRTQISRRVHLTTSHIHHCQLFSVIQFKIIKVFSKHTIINHLTRYKIKRSRIPLTKRTSKPKLITIRKRSKQLWQRTRSLRYLTLTIKVNLLKPTSKRITSKPDTRSTRSLWNSLLKNLNSTISKRSLTGRSTLLLSNDPIARLKESSSLIHSSRNISTIQTHITIIKDSTKPHRCTLITKSSLTR